MLVHFLKQNETNGFWSSLSMYFINHASQKKDNGSDQNSQYIIMCCYNKPGCPVLKYSNILARGV